MSFVPLALSGQELELLITCIETPQYVDLSWYIKQKTFILNLILKQVSLLFQYQPIFGIQTNKKDVRLKSTTPYFQETKSYLYSLQ